MHHQSLFVPICYQIHTNHRGQHIILTCLAYLRLLKSIYKVHVVSILAVQILFLHHQHAHSNPIHSIVWLLVCQLKTNSIPIVQVHLNMCIRISKLLVYPMQDRHLILSRYSRALVQVL